MSRRCSAAVISAVLLSLPAGAAIAQSASDETLGRLFFTPERRSALDRQRLLSIQEAAQPEAPTVTVNGIVSRSGGLDTVWINGTPQTNYSPGAVWSGSLAGPAARIRLTPPGEASRQVNVGETLNRGSGDVTSPLQGGRIGIRRTPQTGDNSDRR